MPLMIGSPSHCCVCLLWIGQGARDTGKWIGTWFGVSATQRTWACRNNLGNDICFISASPSTFSPSSSSSRCRFKTFWQHFVCHNGLLGRLRREGRCAAGAESGGKGVGGGGRGLRVVAATLSISFAFRFCFLFAQLPLDVFIYFISIHTRVCCAYGCVCVCSFLFLLK